MSSLNNLVCRAHVDVSIKLSSTLPDVVSRAPASARPWPLAKAALSRQAPRTAPANPPQGTPPTRQVPHAPSPPRGKSPTRRIRLALSLSQPGRCVVCNVHGVRGSFLAIGQSMAALGTDEAAKAAAFDGGAYFLGKARAALHRHPIANRLPSDRHLSFIGLPSDRCLSLRLGRRCGPRATERCSTRWRWSKRGERRYQAWAEAR